MYRSAAGINCHVLLIRRNFELITFSSTPASQPLQLVQHTGGHVHVLLTHNRDAFANRANRPNRKARKKSLSKAHTQRPALLNRSTGCLRPREASCYLPPQHNRPTQPGPPCHTKPRVQTRPAVNAVVSRTGPTPTGLRFSGLRRQ